MIHFDDKHLLAKVAESPAGALVFIRLLISRMTDEQIASAIEEAELICEEQQDASLRPPPHLRPGP